MSDTDTAAQAMDHDELLAAAQECRQEFAGLPEIGQRSEDESSSAQRLIRKVSEIDAQLTVVGWQEDREQAQKRAESDAALAELASTQGGLATLESRKSLGELFINDEVIDWVTRGATESFSRNMEGMGSLDQLLTRAMQDFGSTGPGANGTAYDPSGAGNLLPVGQPIAPVPRHARLFLRDLIPTMTTTLAVIPYVQELTPLASESASAVAEGGLKPSAAINFIGAKADPTVIAATLTLSKQLFEDASAVVQYVNMRLPYIIKFKEDQEFLNGSGTWPDIQGLLQNANIQTQAVVTDNATTLGQAFADVELHDGTPTAVVLHPTNAWKMFTQRAAGGSGTFDAGTPFSALPLTVWGVPTYRTRAMPINTALVGDFTLGAMIVDREQVNIQTYKERFAELNQILLVCEERVGLMNFRPDLFVSTTLN